MALLLGTGCNVTPDYQPPALDVPTQWRQASTPSTTGIQADWWLQFGSTELNRLIIEALAANNDLAAAGFRVEQAKAQAHIARANLLPTAGLSLGYDAKHNALGEMQSKTLDAVIAYEVDLWGANRAKRDAGVSRWLSERYARDALQLVIMAQVAQGYFNVLALQENQRIAADFLHNADEIQAIIDARFQAGAVSALDVAQQQTVRASAQATLELITQQHALAKNALAILLAQPPQSFSVPADRLQAIAMPVIATQQPASLLQRRPDIQQLEMQLRAANADVGVALAAFYPKLQLNLDTVLANPQPAGIALSMLSSLTQPLFQGGRLEAGLTQAQAHYQELVEHYRQALLTAFKEVEDAAATRRYALLRLQALHEAVAQAQSAYDLSKARYQAGAVDYQTLLNTQRSLLTAENNQIQARLDVLVSLVQLYKAFGGGWMTQSLTLNE